MDENIPTEKKKLAWVENAVKKGCTTLAPSKTNNNFHKPISKACNIRIMYFTPYLVCESNNEC